MIRLGTPDDYASVAQIFRRASLSNAGDRAELMAHPEHLVLAPDALSAGRMYVAVADGSVVGFATWVQVQDGTDLEDLFVDPTWMRRGMASALVAHIVDVLRARGVSCLHVTANPHALGFYRVAGFVEVGEATTELGSGPRMALTIG